MSRPSIGDAAGKREAVIYLVSEEGATAKRKRGSAALRA
jgi:hypothetical protein